MSMDFRVLLLLVTCVRGVFGQVRVLPDSPSVVRKEGEDIIFTCSDVSTSVANQNLRWYGPTGAEISGTGVRVFTESSQGLSRLRVLQIQRPDGGNYTCRGDSGDEITSMLIVFKPITFDSAPAEQNFQVNSDAVLECQVSGDPHPTVVWYRDNNEVGNSAKYRKMANNNLVIGNIQLQDAGIYTCEASVTSDGRFAERDIRVSVLYPPAVFMDTPDTVGAVVGFTVNISCSARGNPTPQMAWYRNGRELLPSSDGNVMIYTAAGVSILGLKVNNSTSYGEYNCTAFNGLGSVSRNIILREAAVPTPPTGLKVAHLSASQATIMFKKSYSESGVPVTHYVTEISGSNGDMSSQVGDASMTTVTLDGLAKNTSYAVRVRGVNIAGASDPSDSLNFTTLTEDANPDAPTILSRKMSTEAVGYELRASVPADLADPVTDCIVSYRPIRTNKLRHQWNNVTLPCSKNDSVSTVFITDLQPDTEYEGRVYARKASGTIGMSDFLFMTAEEVTAKQVGGVSAGGTAAIVIVVLLILIVAADVTCCALGKGGATLFIWNRVRGNAKSIPIKNEEAPAEEVETTMTSAAESQPEPAEPKPAPATEDATSQDVKKAKAVKLPIAIWWSKLKRSRNQDGAEPTDAAEKVPEKSCEEGKAEKSDSVEDSNGQDPKDETEKTANSELVEEGNAKEEKNDTVTSEDEAVTAKPDVVGGTDVAESTETTLLLDETKEEGTPEDQPNGLAV
ncbi:neural cell adhesion molecule 1-like [Branchiostoma lanceolatum]|uniref:neural cell adhesion molecule 1-like n=1 Tax=Branchiostoma lanceolatum TaxID=7740 RepID=UPI003454DF1B